MVISGIQTKMNKHCRCGNYLMTCKMCVLDTVYYGNF